MRTIAFALLLSALAAAPSPLMIARMGKPVTLAQAQARLAFSAFVPRDRAILRVALIPPLYVEKRRDIGIAIEYRDAGDLLVLSEWPMAGAPLGPHLPCAPIAHEPGSFMWTTRTGLVMTLQPDGAVPAPRVKREARRLAAGACRTRN